jgi:hypothetical protein
MDAAPLFLGLIKTLVVITNPAPPGVVIQLNHPPREAELLKATSLRFC